MALIPSDAGLRIKLAADSPLQPLERPREISADLPELRLGQRFVANIQEVLPENTYRALVAGRSLTLSLPEGAKAGDTLELVVIDRTPRTILAQVDNLRQGASFSAHILEVLPGNTYRAAVAGRELTLQLDEPAEAGQTLDLRVVDRTPLSVIAERAPAPGTAAADYPYTTLSQAGRMIGNLLTPEGEAVPAAVLSRGQPLLNQGPTSVAELAGALAKAVTQSGLFYEAHQAQWIAGKRPLVTLLAEPQGRHSQPALLDAHAVTQSASAAGPAPAIEPAPEPSPLRAATLGQEPAATPPTRIAVPEDLRPLVQQQLDAVATQRVLWHGEVWPGQTMEWQIQRRQEEERPAAAADDQRWSTRLNLTTPRLGQVQAAINLAGGAATLVISATDVQAVTRLRNALPELEQALATAGVPLAGIAVKHEAA